MKNLEIKTQVSNLGLIQEKLFFAKKEGFLKQKDTYYLLGKNRLKLREEDYKTELIFYVRPTVKGSRESKYWLIGVHNLLKTPIKKLFTIIFDEKTIVDKDRLLFLYKHTRIHLDKVNKLGEFVELETVFNETLSSDLFIEEHEEVKSLLGLDLFPATAGSYSDLLIKQNNKFIFAKQK